MSIPLIIAFYILFPALAVYLCYKYSFLNKISTVVICYIAGIVIGNIGIFPANAPACR